MKPIALVSAALIGLHLSPAMGQETHAHHSAAMTDTRVVLELSESERAMLLDEMRLFLAGVQEMTGALGKQDMATTAKAARSMGMKMAHEATPALRAKLPLEFRRLGSSVHRDFDQIAMDADSLMDVSHTLGQLSANLQKCVACHSMYQIRTSPSASGH